MQTQMATNSDTEKRTTRSGRFDARRDGLELLGGIGIGAALMYFLDNDRGARRRSLVADKLVHARHVASDAIGATARDLRNRARGTVAEVRSRVRADDADDRVVEERVRAELGRIVPRPGAIVAGVAQGVVTLSGPVPAREADHLVSRVRRVRGVSGVENRLEPHDDGDGEARRLSEASR